MKKRFLAVLTMIFAAVFGLAVFAACGGDETSNEDKDAPDMTISYETLTLAIGDQRTLVATAKEGGQINWTTSNESVVAIQSQVASRGVANIKAVGGGEATLTATSKSGKTISCAVTVDEFTVEITCEGLEGGKLTILRKDDGSYESKTLTATVYRSGQKTDDGVVWTSSDETVLTVDGGKLTAHMLGNATIVATRTGSSAKAEIEVEIKWENVPDGWYAMAETGAGGANQNRGHWTWAGFHGDGGDPALNGEGQGSEGNVTFSVTNNTGWRWYSVQIFYKNTAIEEAGFYKLTLTMTSDIEAKITVNDTEIELTKGENAVTVYYYDAGPDSEDASILIYLAVHDKYRNALTPDGYDDGVGKVFNEGTLSIKDLHWEPYDPSANALAAPTAFSVDAATKEIAVTDANPDEKREGYVIGFFEEGKEQPTYTTAVMKPVEGRNILTDRGGVTYLPDADGNVSADAGKMFLDDSAVAAGEYTLKIKAYSGVAAYGDSAWFASSAKYTKTGAADYKVLPSYRDVDRGVGRYYAWSEWGQIDFAKCSFNGATNTLTMALTGEASWYSNQLYYGPKPDEFKTDHLYELTFTLSAKNADGQDIDLTNKQFIVAGQRVNTTTGTHEYTVRFYYMGGDFTMLFGKPSPDWQSDSADNGDLGAGTYVFSDMQFKDLTDPANEGMVFGVLGETTSVTDKLVYWYAASSALTYAPSLGTTANGATMHEMSCTANSGSDTRYSYTFDYTVDPIEGKFCNWIVRFFYKKSALAVNTEYKLTLVLDASTAGNIIINDVPVSLQKGEHEYHVYYTEQAGKSLWMNMATDSSMILEEKLVIKSLKWEQGTREPLAAPQNGAVTAGVVTFTDPNPSGVDHAEIGLFSGDTLVSTQKIANNGKIDESLHTNGTYTVKLRLCADMDHRDTEWVAIGSYTVTNGSPVSRGTMADAVNNKGNWYVWLDDGGNGSTATLTKAELDAAAKTMTVGYTTAGSPRLGFSVQLFYEDPNAVTGKTYTFSLKVKLSVAGTITINDKQITFTAGQEQELSIVYTEKGVGYEDWNAGASAVILMGVGVAAEADGSQNAVMAAEITISGWTFEELTSNPNGDVYVIPSTTLQDDGIPADSTFYYYAEYPSDGLHNAKFDHGVVTFDIAGHGNWHSNRIFYKSMNVPQTQTYTFTMKLESEVAGVIRINETFVTLKVGTNDIEIQGSKGMLAMYMGEPPRGADGNYEWDRGGNASPTIENCHFTLSEFRWTASDGTVYGLDGKIS